MDIVELPLVSDFISPVSSLEKMQESHVAACVVVSAKKHYLLRLERVLESLNEWTLPPTKVGRLIIPDEMTDGLPVLAGDYTALSRVAVGGLTAGEMQLDGHFRRYGLVKLTLTTAFVATRSERLGGNLRNPPNLYKCTVNETHIYSGDRVGAALLCPNIAHTAPKPSMVKL